MDQDLAIPIVASLACVICRSRKVRCDRLLPDCRNCIRLGVPCPGYNPDTESMSRKDMQKIADKTFKTAGVEKRRVGSCRECRASKHGCSKEQPNCQRCILKNLKCEYPSRRCDNVVVDKLLRLNMHDGSISSPEPSSDSPDSTVFDSNSFVTSTEWHYWSLPHEVAPALEQTYNDAMEYHEEPEGSQGDDICSSELLFQPLHHFSTYTSSESIGSVCPETSVFAVQQAAHCMVDSYAIQTTAISFQPRPLGPEPESFFGGQTNTLKSDMNRFSWGDFTMYPNTLEGHAMLHENMHIGTLDSAGATEWCPYPGYSIN